LVSVLDDLESQHPGFRERLFDDQGELRRFVNVFVADEDIRFLDGVNTDVADGATVSIVPRRRRRLTPHQPASSGATLSSTLTHERWGQAGTA